MLLFRKIDETRWFGKGLLESLSVTELNTKDNELSVWMDYRKVFDLDLVLAFALTQSCFKGIWCVKIPEEMLDASGISLHQQDSSTCYIRMRPYHNNIVVPTMWELGAVAEIIHKLVQDTERNCAYYPESMLKKHYYDILKQDLIEINFNDKKNKSKWDALNQMQKEFGDIDFSLLKNVVAMDTKKK